MSPNRGRLAGMAWGLGLAALALPAAAWAQGPAERTGPLSAPPSLPAYARPTPAAAPGPDASVGAAPSGEPEALTALHVAEASAGTAIPPRAWSPPQEPAANLRLDHRPGQPLDADWVRAQFEVNGLPGPDAGVSRALALTQLINRGFLSAGFINSGLVVRPGARPGVLELALVYGGLVPPAQGAPAIGVTWVGGQARGLDGAYVRDRLPSAAGRPLSGVDLERDFRLLAEDAAIRTVNADLRPGSRPGEASLTLSIYPQDRADLYVVAANSRSPSVGGERGAVGGLVRNLASAGDVFSGEVGVTRGLQDAALSYARPFLSPRNTIAVRAALNDAAVIAHPLVPLDIRAHDRSVELGLTRKLFDTPLLPADQPGRWLAARTVSAGILLTRRVSKTYLQDQPFSFAPGSVNGRSDYTALRLTGDYLVRSVDQVFAVSLTASRGLEGSGSDVPGSPAPRPGFDVLLAQVNYARRLSSGGLELRARLSGQIADSILYSGERFSAGGETTVRGYRENLILADNGLIGSVELARPVRLSRVQGGDGRFDWGAFNLAVFVDAAAMRNVHPPQPQRPIASLGLSLAWIPSDVVSAQLTYGVELAKAQLSGDKDIQDHGLAFRLTMHPLRIRR